MLSLFFLLFQSQAVVIEPAADGCSFGGKTNTIVDLEMSATCNFVYNPNYNHSTIYPHDTTKSCDLESDLTTFTIRINADGKDFTYVVNLGDPTQFADSSLPVEYSEGLSFSFGSDGYKRVTAYINGEEAGTTQMRVIPGWVTLIPIFILFAVAILTKQVLIALPSGIWMAQWVIERDLNPIMAFWNTWDLFVVNFADNAGVLVFTLTIAGAIAIVNKSGGSQGLANLLIPFIKDSRTAAAVGFSEGIMIFFDDYADTLICGTTLRSFMDMNRMSRERFAFLVDATAAPIASVAPISSWIGFELSLVKDYYIDKFGSEEYGDNDAYTVFMETLPYRFYPWLMLFFMVTNIASCREYGPMAQAEKRTRATGKVVRDGANVDESALKGDPHMDPKPEVVEAGLFFWYLAAVPIAVLVFGTLIVIIETGSWACEDEGIPKTAKNIFGNGDSYKALLWSSVLAAIVGACMARFKNTLFFEESLDAWIYGMKGMMEPVVILVWAWSFGSIVGTIGTSDFIVDSLGDSLTDVTLPFVSFLISGLCSLMMGSSWATMSLMFPLVMPLAQEVANGDRDVVLHCIGTILAGAVFGDHCSPISDTTVLSSIACGCDLQDHVTTQLPYAMTVGFIGAIFGDLVTRAGGGAMWVGSYIISMALLGFIIFFFGTPIPIYSPMMEEEISEQALAAMSPFESLIGIRLWSKPIQVEETPKEIEIDRFPGTKDLVATVDTEESSAAPMN